MLFRATELTGHKIAGIDGDVGRVKDVLFDDMSWAVRYLVVDTGSWLESREVLLAPTSVQGLQPGAATLTTELTKEQVRSSPPVVADLPVSRAYEERLYSHYGWTPYWSLPLYAEPGLYTYPLPVDSGLTPFANPTPGDPLSREADEMLARARENADPHLRSYKEVKGYHIAARDGEIGHVDDLLIDTNLWLVTHFIVDTRNWIPGRHVVVDRGAVTALRFEDGKAVLALTRAQIKDSPEYEPGLGLDDAYQQRLSRYYREQRGSSEYGDEAAF